MEGLQAEAYRLEEGSTRESDVQKEEGHPTHTTKTGGAHKGNLKWGSHTHKGQGFPQRPVLLYH